EVGRISSDAFEEIERDPCAEHISSLVSEAETKARRSDISEAEEKSLPIPNPDTHYSSFVRVIPGPSAVIAALVASGLPSDTFYFGGFLPRKAKALRDVLQTLATLDATLVFYESPQRLVKTLDACAEVLGERRAAVVRELTKMHEEVVRDQLPQLAAQFSARDSIKGEIVLVIALAQREKVARVHVDKYGG
ncbi:MAG: SAM-dependent methyltransferase, partial [Actinomycetia bacterium]|nr:SAM-dependent methyltransferase [Actinomycetes bacterium]